jgi:energy-coupling factor transporter ATP-binding protein EcfA2
VQYGLMGNPTLLLMDEPLEGLAPVIVDALLAGLDRLKREDGLAMLLVEQHARLALELAPDTIVLDRGGDRICRREPRVARGTAAPDYSDGYGRAGSALAECCEFDRDGPPNGRLTETACQGTAYGDLWQTPGASVNPITDYLTQSRDAVQAAIDDPAFTAAIRDIADVTTNALRYGGKLLLAGNGGSAGDAQHLAGEMLSRLYYDRAPCAAIALTTDSSVLTAIGNDYGYERVF